MPRRPIVGDVIVCADFAYCIAKKARFVLGTPNVDVLSPTKARTKEACQKRFFHSAEKRKELVKAGQTDPGEYSFEDGSRFDESRGNAPFVILSAEDISEVMGRENTWCFIARRMIPSGQDDLNGELIEFTDTFPNNISSTLNFITLRHLSITFI